MLTIKRYPNRKFYDTEEKRYITLDDIAHRIREGREIQVIDNTNGEDITTIVLTQIIFEQEKKQIGFVPRSVLTGLVQAGGYTIGRMRRALANPLELLKQIDEEIERRIVLLTNRGDLGEDEANRLRKKLLADDISARETTQLDEAAIQQILERDGIPTRKELNALSQQLDNLVQKLTDLETKS
jgi:polyhydroxyalkanoate synthesis repressor PhaR